MLEQTRHSAWKQFLAVLYILLLAFPVSLGGRASVSDLLVPIMGLVVLKSWRVIDWRQFVLFPLGFLFFALVSVLSHPHSSGGSWISDCYEWMTFAYAGVLLIYFLNCVIPPRVSLRLGVVLEEIVLVACLYELLSCVFPLPSFFSYQSQQMADTAMPFLCRRFQFMFDNPNMFGTFAMLPPALILRGIRERQTPFSPKEKILVLLGCAAWMVPLAWSASKHGIMSVALLMMILLTVFRLGRVWLMAGIGMLLLMIAVCETTVLFATFPVSVSPAGINTTPGMYTIHQKAYARMIQHGDAVNALTGFGETRARELYPTCVDAVSAESTLRHYNALDNLQGFTSFMDPHNEYLNLVVLFGFPAALVMMLFWLRQMPGNHWQDALFILAVLASCLWDDLLTKRAVWTAAGILLAGRSSRRVS